MRLPFPLAVVLALLANLVPVVNRPATNRGRPSNGTLPRQTRPN
jgi:hypothetical protein